MTRLPFPDTARRRLWGPAAAWILSQSLAGPASAQGNDVTVGIPIPSHFPEAILVPIRSSIDPGGTGGWILTFRNQLSGPDTPDREVETRTITTAGTGGAPVVAVIAWAITRTRNDRCAQQTGKGCPDTIEILSVPAGFIAVPKSATVEEQAVQRIFIVPEGIS